VLKSPQSQSVAAHGLQADGAGVGVAVGAGVGVAVGEGVGGGVPLVVMV